MQRVEGVVQHYAWGDRDFIPNLLGLPPDGRPWAELWLGTHPNGAAALDDGTPLVDLAGPLPYLLKVLACSEPLSLQTHPDAEQARRGFDAGIFPDSSPKPELLCALTPFEAFCGVRPIAASQSVFDELGLDQWSQLLGSDGPAAVLRGVYCGDLDVGSVVDACSGSSIPEAIWVRKLAATYPGDPSVAATLLLNRVVLEPGDAIRLDAGTLHAYLHGAGIEVMAPSDNVVRGGLTVKPVDVELLLEVATTTPLDHPVLTPGHRYELPAAGVALERLDTGQERNVTGHELAIDLLGNTWYCAPGDTFVAGDVTYVVVTT